MTIGRNLALSLWDAIFGNNTKWVQDPFGTWMYRDDYGNHNSRRNDRPGGDGRYYDYGWDLDHIRPISSFETEYAATFRNNLEPMHWQNNNQKSDGCPNFQINGENYQIVKCEICGNHKLQGYGILDVKSNKRIDWKSNQGKYFINNR